MSKPNSKFFDKSSTLSFGAIRLSIVPRITLSERFKVSKLDTLFPSTLKILAFGISRFSSESNWFPSRNTGVAGFFAKLKNLSCGRTFPLNSFRNLKLEKSRESTFMVFPNSAFSPRESTLIIVRFGRKLSLISTRGFIANLINMYRGRANSAWVFYYF